MAYHPIHRKWRVPKALWWILPFELAAIVACLAMFGIAQPDTYRTILWDIGGKEHWNSSPSYILYAYANYRPIPTTPFVWSQTLTDFNVAISVISLFVFISKLVMIIMRIFFPILGLFVHLVLFVLYIVSMYGQMGPDHLDERYPSSIAWYLRKDCSVVAKYGAEKYCKMAKGTFAATVYMIAVVLVFLGLAIWSMLPNPANDVKDEDDEDDSNAGSENGREKGWEMRGLRSPTTPRTGGLTPFTPRTQAFHTLDRKLPLRNS